MQYQAPFPIKRLNPALLSLILAATCMAENKSGPASPAPKAGTIRESTVRTYAVRQTVEVRDIPQDAKKVRLWLSIPDDASEQRLMDIGVVDVPGSWRLVREAMHGNQFLYTEVEKPGKSAIKAVIDFTIRRQSVFFDLDPLLAKSLSESQRRLFAEELRLDAPHMEVTETISKIARETCGDLTNPVEQARKLLNYVAEHADHYSKDPSKPKCGVGDAANCMMNGGGCCTDLHSLFIALSRARGIPARLQMGYRLQARNEGVEADPGYRCWPEYFVAGYGWVPADIVEADAAEGESRVQWLSGLSERRVHLNEGRNFVLTPRQEGGPVNTMIIGYAEIDGVPARVLPEGEKQPQLARTVLFKEISSGALAGTSQAK